MNNDNYFKYFAYKDNKLYTEDNYNKQDIPEDCEYVGFINKQNSFGCDLLNKLFYINGTIVEVNEQININLPIKNYILETRVYVEDNKQNEVIPVYFKVGYETEEYQIYLKYDCEKNNMQLEYKSNKEDLCQQ